jgi:excisionase family DNA binding protein
VYILSSPVTVQLDIEREGRDMGVGKLLSLNEVAERTLTSVAFWRKAVSRKSVPIVKIGRLTRLREEDVNAFCRIGFVGRAEK